jgi:orotidine-5'-phosphate decarboxylase
MYEDRIIVALDVASAEEARSLAGRLGEKVGFYKVGLELYAAAGMEIVRELQARGKQVFLDLKLFDIGETVKRTVEVLARTGIRFLTVHSSKAVMQAAVAGRGDAPLKILAVTVLTSFDDQDVHDLGYSGSVAQLVEWRARKCVECGVDGVIASPLDAFAVRRMIGPRMLIVTPGVRSAGASRGDQKRVATPAEAIRDTADYLVLGRQITRAADPEAELERVLQEMVQADTARPGSSR